MDDALLVRRLERVGDLPGDRSASSSGIGAARDALARASSPSTSSMTSARAPPRVFDAVDLRDVRMVQRGERLASRSNRASRSGSRANASGRILIATSRSSLVSRAR